MRDLRSRHDGLWTPLSARLAMSLAVVGICACGGPKTTSLTPSPSEEVIKKIPEWYLQPPEDSKHLYATGAATSRDLQISVQKAKMSAQADLSQQISTRFGNLSKQFQEETGQEEDSELLTQFSAAAKAVSQETLVGSKVEKKEILPEKQIYRAYVLMSLPLGEANQRLMQKIKADQNLYTKLRATEAYKELDRELEALK